MQLISRFSKWKNQIGILLIALFAIVFVSQIFSKTSFSSLNDFRGEPASAGIEQNVWGLSFAVDETGNKILALPPNSNLDTVALIDLANSNVVFYKINLPNFSLINGDIKAIAIDRKGKTAFILVSGQNNCAILSLDLAKNVVKRLKTFAREYGVGTLAVSADDNYLYYTRSANNNLESWTYSSSTPTSPYLPKSKCCFFETLVARYDLANNIEDIVSPIAFKDDLASYSWISHGSPSQISGGLLSDVKINPTATGVYLRFNQRFSNAPIYDPARYDGKATILPLKEKEIYDLWWKNGISSEFNEEIKNAFRSSLDGVMFLDNSALFNSKLSPKLVRKTDIDFLYNFVKSDDVDSMHVKRLYNAEAVTEDKDLTPYEMNFQVSDNEQYYFTANFAKARNCWVNKGGRNISCNYLFSGDTVRAPGELMNEFIGNPVMTADGKAAVFFSIGKHVGQDPNKPRIVDEGMFGDKILRICRIEFGQTFSSCKWQTLDEFRKTNINVAN